MENVSNATNNASEIMLGVALMILAVIAVVYFVQRARAKKDSTGRGRAQGDKNQRS